MARNEDRQAFIDVPILLKAPRHAQALSLVSRWIRTTRFNKQGKPLQLGGPQTGTTHQKEGAFGKMVNQLSAMMYDNLPPPPLPAACRAHGRQVL